MLKLSRFSILIIFLFSLILSFATNAPGAGAQQNLTVEWDQSTGVFNPFLRTLNVFRFYNIPPRRQEAIRAAVSFMKPGLIRLHDGGLIKRWYDPALHDWDYEKIKADMELIQSLESTPIMLAIPGWPTELNRVNSSEIDSSKIPVYSDLCLKLVRHMIKTLHVPIQYVEITNEKDFIYWQKSNSTRPNGPGDLAAIYKSAADAIKAEFPFLKIGGPAASSVQPLNKLIEFSKAAGSSLDFISFHYYATGTPATPTSQLFERSGIMFSAVEKFAKAVQGSGHSPDIFMDEFNINYNWKNKDVRMNNEIGSAFDASIIFRAAYSPLALAGAWNAVDTGYGKMSAIGTRWPSSYLYHYLHNLKGKTIKVSTSTKTLIALATRTDKEAGFAITNISSDAQSISVQHLKLPSCKWHGATVDATGARQISSVANPTHFELAPYETTIYWTSSRC